MARAPKLATLNLRRYIMDCNSRWAEEKDRLKSIRPIALDNTGGIKIQRRPFDHCDLYLFFDAIFKKIDDLENEVKEIKGEQEHQKKQFNHWIDALAKTTGKRFDYILERLNVLDKEGIGFPAEK